VNVETQDLHRRWLVTAPTALAVSLVMLSLGSAHMASWGMESRSKRGDLLDWMVPGEEKVPLYSLERMGRNGAY
jgi:hypothetical protein